MVPDWCESVQVQLPCLREAQLGGVPDSPELPMGSGWSYPLWDLVYLLPFSFLLPDSLTSLSWDHFLNKPLAPKFLSHGLLLGTLKNLSQW